jgi:hypothetical protein
MRNETPEQAERRKQVEDMENDSAGFTRADLAKIGVSWPPKKGWKDRYIKTGVP